MSSHYCTAQVCRNGHATTAMLEKSPDRAADHCPECGAPTLSTCCWCGAPSRGYYFTPGVLSLSPYTAPRFCHQCGTAYPWTRAAVEAWREMAHEVEGLTPEERAGLAKSIDDLIADTPRTQTAIQRLKQLAPKVNRKLWPPMKELLMAVATDAVKKSIGS